MTTNATILPISESELRIAVRVMLAEKFRVDHARVMEEFSIESGASRVDFAAVNGRLVGFELKSDFDSFARMSNQIHAYNRVFDRVTLIVGLRHQRAAEYAIPSWWGLTIATKTPDGHIHFSEVRKPRVNPAQEAYSLARLLWSEEAKKILADEQRPFPPKASRAELYDLIANSIPLRRVRALVTNSIRTRSALTAAT